jgi:hypothetical protein
MVNIGIAFSQFVYVSLSHNLSIFQQNLSIYQRFQVTNINLLYFYILFFNFYPIIIDLNHNNHHLHIAISHTTMHNINLHKKKLKTYII